ncbi:2151_t:CDS:2, partial [Racocetra persica]
DNPYIQHNKDIINKPLQQEKTIVNAPPPKKQPRKLCIGNTYSSNIDYEVADPVIVVDSTIQECDRFRMIRIKVDAENNPFVNWKIMPSDFKVPENYHARCSKTETTINENRIRIDAFSVIPKNMNSDAFFEMEIELNEGFSYCVFNCQEESDEELQPKKQDITDEDKFDEITVLSQDGKPNNEETTQKIRIDQVNNDQNVKSNAEKIQYVLKGGRFVQEKDSSSSS